MLARMFTRFVQRPGCPGAWRAMSTFGDPGDAPSAIYANYRIYKGSASMSMSALPPKFRGFSRKDDSYALQVEKAGVILLEFVPTLPAPSGAGARAHDYDRKQFFSLSAGECGEFIAKTSVRQKCQFIHDPQGGFGGGGRLGGGGGGDQNSAIKRLVVDPMKDKDGFFFNLNTEAGQFNVPVTPGEFIVTRQLFLSAIPHLLGFNKSFDVPAQMAEPAFGDQGGQGFQRGGGAKPAGDGVVFNPFEQPTQRQRHDGVSGRGDSKPSSNWLDEL
jgi:hypothetical protein